MYYPFHSEQSVAINYAINDVVILLGNSNGIFRELREFLIGYDSHSFLIAFGGFNQDNKLDFSVANEGIDNMQIMLQTCYFVLWPLTGSFIQWFFCNIRLLSIYCTCISHRYFENIIMRCSITFMINMSLKVYCLSFWEVNCLSLSLAVKKIFFNALFSGWSNDSEREKIDSSQKWINFVGRLNLFGRIFTRRT